MNNIIDPFYLDIVRIKNNYLNQYKDDITIKLICGKVNNCLRKYNPQDWNKLFPYYQKYINYCSSYGNVSAKSLIAFIIISNYKNEILNINVSVLDAIIDALFYNNITPYLYPDILNVFLSKDIYIELKKLNHNHIHPLSFILEAILECYSVEELKIKNKAILKEELKLLSSKNKNKNYDFNVFNFFNNLKKKKEKQESCKIYILKKE